MDALEEFEQLVTRPSVPLDASMLAIAAIDRPDLDRGHYLRRLDDLAAQCDEPTSASIARTLFAELLFSGNASEYYDARNSYLDEVIERRLGIPISLAALAISVGERLGCELRCVGLPGHVLLRDMTSGQEHPYIDAFGGGVRLSEDDVHVFFARRSGGARLDPQHLRPLATPAVLFRVLNNLKAIFESSGDARLQRRALSYQVCLPGSPPVVRRELASALATAGQYDDAAAQLEALAALVEDREAIDREIGRLRARLN